MVCTVSTPSEGAVWYAQFQIVKYFVLSDGPSGSSLMLSQRKYFNSFLMLEFIIWLFYVFIPISHEME